jgi:hypothetical protein
MHLPDSALLVKATRGRRANIPAARGTALSATEPRIQTTQLASRARICAIAVALIRTRSLTSFATPTGRDC